MTGILRAWLKFWPCSGRPPDRPPIRKREKAAAVSGIASGVPKPDFGKSRAEWGETYPESRNAFNSRIWGTGKGTLASSVGSTLPWTLSQPSVQGVLWNAQFQPSRVFSAPDACRDIRPKSSSLACFFDPGFWVPTEHWHDTSWRAPSQKATDVWKNDVWKFQAPSQIFFELRFSLGNEG